MEYFFAAYKAVDEVLRKKAYSGITLNEYLKDAGKDSRLITKIVYGVIEKSIELDYIISKLCKTPPKPAVKNILKLGIYCVKYMGGIPLYAVISNSLKLCDKLGKGSVKGFVNGVLATAAKYEIKYPSDYMQMLSIKYGVSEGIIKMLMDEYGGGIEKILSGNNDTREHIRPNLLKTSVSEFEELLGQNNIAYEKSDTRGYYINYSDIINSGISDNLYTVMGYSSMYIINLFDISGGQDILDACAAPGGKSIYMAEKNPECHITSCDIHPHRAELIEKYAKRMGAENITAKVCDSSAFNPGFENKFGTVLCDVPCSGFGMAHKKPEIKLNLTPEDIKSLSKVQLSILSNCAKYVKEKGRLIYSTCTIFKQENENVAEKFLSQNNGFILSPRLNSDRYSSDGYIKMVNGINSPEGFFTAEFIRL